MVEKSKGGAKAGAEKEKSKKTKKAKDPNAPKGFGATLKDKVGNSIRVQAKPRNGKFALAITHTTVDPEGNKTKKVGARAERDTAAAAQTWINDAMIKLKTRGWGEKSKGSRTKENAFDLDNLPTPAGFVADAATSDSATEAAPEATEAEAAPVQ